MNSRWEHYLVGYGLLRRAGSVLLVGNRWRWDPRFPVVWTLPGGRAEEGEPLTDAIRREFQEETGLVPEVGPLLWVTEVFDFAKHQHFISFIFLVTKAEGEPEPAGDEHVIEARFVEESALADYLRFPTFRDPLLAYLRSPGEAPRYYLYNLGKKEDEKGRLGSEE